MQSNLKTPSNFEPQNQNNLQIAVNNLIEQNRNILAEKEAINQCYIESLQNNLKNKHQIVLLTNECQRLQQELANSQKHVNDLNAKLANLTNLESSINKETKNGSES